MLNSLAQQKAKQQARKRAEERKRKARIAKQLTGTMVAIKGGCFQMGSPASEKGRSTDEHRHKVCVKDFRLGKYEVTVAQFRRFVDATKYKTDAEKNTGGENGCFAYDRKAATNWKYRKWASWRKPNQYAANQPTHPVSCVSWRDAKAYLKWVNGLTGLKFRLSTEAQWEYAARAGTSTARYWGDDPNDACGYANVADESRDDADYGYSEKDRHHCNGGHAFVAKVGSYKPNAFGLYDMLGNVWEWTCSIYDGDYGSSQESRCASGGNGVRRVIRGGSWNNKPRNVRSANRNRNTTNNRNNNLGFRLAHYVRDSPEPACPRIRRAWRGRPLSSFPGPATDVVAQ